MIVHDNCYKLTLLRIALIPVFLGVLYAGFPGCRYWALAIFVIASLTDFLDGYIARHYNRSPTSESLHGSACRQGTCHGSNT